jgi:hypothetical protein
MLLHLAGKRKNPPPPPPLIGILYGEVFSKVKVTKANRTNMEIFTLKILKILWRLKLENLISFINGLWIEDFIFN